LVKCPVHTVIGQVSSAYCDWSSVQCILWSVVWLIYI